jgi:hypothetical protein
MSQMILAIDLPWDSFNDRFLVDASTRETIETGLKNIALVKQTGNSSQDALSWLASKRED